MKLFFALLIFAMASLTSSLIPQESALIIHELEKKLQLGDLSGSNDDISIGPLTQAALRSQILHNLSIWGERLSAYIIKEKFDHINFGPQIHALRAGSLNVRRKLKLLTLQRKLPCKVLKVYKEQFDAMVKCYENKNTYESSKQKKDRIISEMTELRVLALAYKHFRPTEVHHERLNTARILRLYCTFLAAIKNLKACAVTVFGNDATFWTFVTLTETSIEDLRVEIKDKSSWGVCSVADYGDR